MATLVSVLACKPAVSAPPIAAVEVVAAGSDETRQLLVDLGASGALCERVRDRFFALPNKAGVVDGRWWIKVCSAQAVRGQLLVHLGGSGWTWVNQEEWGFRVERYVGFDATVDVLVRLELGYDASSGIASVWVMPVGRPLVGVRARGPVSPRPESLLAELVDVVWSDFVEGKAANSFREEGGKRFRDAVGRGLTVTIDARKGPAVDASGGILRRGEVAARPFGSVPRSVVNERNVQRPRGVHVLGPFEPGAFDVDLSIESGSGLKAMGVCAEEALAHLGGTAPSDAAFWTELFAHGRRASAVTAACPWYLLTTDSADVTVFAILVARR